MIIDTSALLAVALFEPDRQLNLDAMAGAEWLRISAGNWLEACIVVDRRDATIKAKFETVLAEAATEIVPVTAEHASLARSAYARFGRGNHPARLNYGDCFAYALAKATGEPLLFKGDDFSQTDILPALPA